MAKQTVTNNDDQIIACGDQDFVRRITRVGNVRALIISDSTCTPGALPFYLARWRTKTVAAWDNDVGNSGIANITQARLSRGDAVGLLNSPMNYSPFAAVHELTFGTTTTGNDDNSLSNEVHTTFYTPLTRKFGGPSGAKAVGWDGGLMKRIFDNGLGFRASAHMIHTVNGCTQAKQWVNFADRTALTNVYPVNSGDRAYFTTQAGATAYVRHDLQVPAGSTTGHNYDAEYRVNVRHTENVATESGKQSILVATSIDTEEVGFGAASISFGGESIANYNDTNKFSQEARRQMGKTAFSGFTDLIMRIGLNDYTDGPTFRAELEAFIADFRYHNPTAGVLLIRQPESGNLAQAETIRDAMISLAQEGTNIGFVSELDVMGSQFLNRQDFSDANGTDWNADAAYASGAVVRRTGTWYVLKWGPVRNVDPATDGGANWVSIPGFGLVSGAQTAANMNLAFTDNVPHMTTAGTQVAGALAWEMMERLSSAGGGSRLIFDMSGGYGS